MAKNRPKSDSIGLFLEGTSYQNFINAIKSPATKAGYENSIRRYLNHIRKEKADDLLSNTNQRYIESQITDYIMSLRNTGISYATIQFLVAPIFTFYQLNDVTLNRKKVSRYLGEYKRVVRDGSYSTEQLQQMMRNADYRMSLILQLHSSTACRLGSLPGLVLGNLTRLPDHGLYRIVFYEGTNNEYYSFTTVEGASYLESWLFYRQRSGEKISFNESSQKWEPYDTPLIRTQFDVNDLLQVRNPKPMTIDALRWSLASYLRRCGIRDLEHPTSPDSPRRVRKSVSLSKGFRKRSISIFIECNLNHEIRELIVDHATQLDQHYFRPTQEAVLREYMKAHDLLLVDQSLRLARENQTLKEENTKYAYLYSRIENLYTKLGL